MTLMLARVDQKLIHGQVTVSWAPYLNIDAMVVVDEEIAEDSWTQKIMRMGLPPEIRDAFFVTPEQVPELAAALVSAGRRTLLLFKDLRGVMTATGLGFGLPALNLGNQAYLPAERAERLAETFYATVEDLEHLAALTASGVKVYLQAIPSARPVVWSQPKSRP